MNTYFLACFLLLLTHAASECPPSTEFTSSVVVVEFVGCPSGLLPSHLELLASKFKDTYNSPNKGLSSNTNTCDPVFREVTLVTASLPTNFELDFDGSSDEAESDFECPGKFEVRFDITVGCQGCDLNPVTLFDEDNDAGGRHLVLRKLQLRHDTRQLQNDCTCDINLEYRAVTEEEMVDAYNRALDQLSGLPSLSVEDVIEIKQVQCDSVKSNFTTTIDLIFDTDSPDETVSAEILITLSDNLLRSYNDLAERFCDPNFRKVQTVEVDKSTVTPGTRRELLTFTTNSVLNVQLSLEGSCRGCGNDSGLFDDAARRRLTIDDAMPSPTPHRKGRRLQQGTQCFCAAVNFVDGAPTAGEFEERYKRDVRDLADQGMLGGNNYAVTSLGEA